MIFSYFSSLSLRSLRYPAVVVIAAVVLAVFLSAPSYAVAVSIVPQTCATASSSEILAKCGVCALAQAFKNATDIMITISGPLAVMFLLYAAVLFLTSGGSQERVSQAKKVATSAAVGLVIVLLSWVILNTIINVIFGAKLSAPWSSFTC
ncbi:MAG: hypothetical protein A2939_03690 [Parcubacteria group bacterium RIFCSPLOWO2_01_FULL_48_18]|nr:MAG: hypothetical protein A3J67_02630 [Parcubacteria group bacterium RIFCSPHIGHO2_02_FULL_48_10b]OHB22380.1 MAG: hypothetical protein A2939_03690 [Parcubacteria group bacterium RIFCSPLOWO2_01_FULL_48_18]